MQKTFHQHKLIFIIGCVIIPSILYGALFYYKEENISGLLKTISLPAYIICFLLLAWLVFLLFHEGKNILKHLDYIVLIILISISLLLPYTSEAAINSNLHIIFAYAALIFMNILFYKIHFNNFKYRNIYSIICLFCFFHCVLAMRITGLAEVTYASAVSILLTLLY